MLGAEGQRDKQGIKDSRVQARAARPRPAHVTPLRFSHATDCMRSCRSSRLLPPACSPLFRHIALSMALLRTTSSYASPTGAQQDGGASGADANFSSAHEVLRVSHSLCFRHGIYENYSALLTVRVKGGVVYSSDAREATWTARHCSFLRSLNRTVSSTPRLQTVDTIFAIWPHDGCSAQVPVTHLSYGISPSCSRSLPLPWMPDEHNPFVEDAKTVDSARRLHAQLTRLHPHGSRRYRRHIGEAVQRTGHPLIWTRCGQHHTR